MNNMLAVKSVARAAIVGRKTIGHDVTGTPNEWNTIEAIQTLAAACPRL
jgi:hypothetical protein